MICGYNYRIIEHVRRVQSRTDDLLGGLSCERIVTQGTGYLIDQRCALLLCFGEKRVGIRTCACAEHIKRDSDASGDCCRQPLQ